MTADVGGELAVDIVTEVARVNDTAETELEPPLGAVLDIDALGQLVHRTGLPLRVTFEYLGCEVTVRAEDGDSDVYVRSIS